MLSKYFPVQLISAPAVKAGRGTNYKQLKLTIMKQINRLSSKFVEYCELSNIDINKVRTNLNAGIFVIKLNRTEAKDAGCDGNYPYIIENPYGINLNK